jgi:hypothetical protein
MSGSATPRSLGVWHCYTIESMRVDRAPCGCLVVPFIHSSYSGTYRILLGCADHPTPMMKWDRDVGYRLWRSVLHPKVCFVDLKKSVQ